jgi:hypothetical protein
MTNRIYGPKDNKFEDPFPQAKLITMRDLGLTDNPKGTPELVDAGRKSAVITVVDEKVTTSRFDSDVGRRNIYLLFGVDGWEGEYRLRTQSKPIYDYFVHMKAAHKLGPTPSGHAMQRGCFEVVQSDSNPLRTYVAFVEP